MKTYIREYKFPFTILAHLPFLPLSADAYQATMNVFAPRYLWLKLELILRVNLFVSRRVYLRGSAPDGDTTDILQHDLDNRPPGVRADRRHSIDETEYLIERDFILATADSDPATPLPIGRTTTAIEPYASPALQSLSKRQIDWRTLCRIFPWLSFCPPTSVPVNASRPVTSYYFAKRQILPTKLEQHAFISTSMVQTAVRSPSSLPIAWHLGLMRQGPDWWLLCQIWPWLSFCPPLSTPVTSKTIHTSPTSPASPWTSVLQPSIHPTDLSNLDVSSISNPGTTATTSPMRPNPAQTQLSQTITHSTFVFKTSATDLTTTATVHSGAANSIQYCGQLIIIGVTIGFIITMAWI